MKRHSFSHLEKQFEHELRDRVNNAENKRDLNELFSSISARFMLDATGGEMAIRNDDIDFMPDNPDYFKISTTLMSNSSFADLWNSSDISNVLKRFAESVHNRWIHLDKHPEKTEKKIRN